jgi:proteasome alpha subunit
MGGQADKVSGAIEGGWQRDLSFAAAIRLAGRGLVTDNEAPDLPAKALEVAVLDRSSESNRGTRRAFRRLSDQDVVELLAEES